MSNNIVPIGENRSQKPSNSAFKQQKLSAWQPILTAGTVLPTFFLIGVAFIPVGIGLLISSYQVKEHEVDYTSCEKYDENSTQTVLCSEFIERNPNSDCKCVINFTLPNDIKRDVFIYYGLLNFYQNHRRYVKSRSDNQLIGNVFNERNCEPFQKRLDPTDNQMKTIMPCGAIANSIFNDTFLLKLLAKKENENRWFEVPFEKTGIAWATDKKNKFRNPSLSPGQSLAQAFNNTVQPANWHKPIYELDTGEPKNNGLQNEGLIVWMRTAAFPTFRKVLARIAHDKRDSFDVDYQNGLPKGFYQLTIDYRFPVAAFKGKKRFIISNTSWLGGRNPFHRCGLHFVGISSLILSAVFLIIHRKFNKNSTDNMNITSQTAFIANS
ncbi:Cell cycle control protein 50A [Tyrophagus putrescentiae]|nr:Cell cycle control protein 50A [Tyrophagus putrescentiae]